MTTEIPCMIHKVVCGTKREARRVAKAWLAQEGTLGVDLVEFRRGMGAVVRVSLPVPFGPMPDDCYAGVFRAAK